MRRLICFYANELYFKIARYKRMQAKMYLVDPYTGGRQFKILFYRIPPDWWDPTIYRDGESIDDLKKKGWKLQWVRKGWGINDIPPEAYNYLTAIERDHGYA